MTRQRELILKLLEHDCTHPTADEVYQRVKKHLPRISLATVYRNLEVLSQEGSIQRLDAGGTQRRFDGTVDDHYHVRCIKCGRVDDIELEPPNGLISEAKHSSDYEIIGHRLLFQGICPECKEK
jgi:Fur family ferric uptake transcriptional regulator